MLHAFTHALYYYHKKKVKGCGDGGQIEDFPYTILRLLSTRSHICCAAMDRHLEMYEMMVQIVYKGFNEMENSSIKGDINMAIRIENKDVKSEVCLSLQLLQAAIVLVANGRNETNYPSQEEFQSLTKYMVRSDFPLEGASSAKCKESGKLVVSVEEVCDMCMAICVKECVRILTQRNHDIIVGFSNKSS